MLLLIHFEFQIGFNYILDLKPVNAHLQKLDAIFHAEISIN